MIEVYGIGTKVSFTQDGKAYLGSITSVQPTATKITYTVQVLEQAGIVVWDEYKLVYHTEIEEVK